MSTPIARWTPNGWEQWFTPSPEGLKVIEFVALAEGADKASRPRGRTAERVWIEEVDADAYAAWMAKHPNAKPVSASHLFASVREAERHLGYSYNSITCRLIGSKRSEFVKLSCGVSVCYEKNIPD